MRVLALVKKRDGIVRFARRLRETGRNRRKTEQNGKNKNENYLT
jgi:hypothetical protein